ncbi:hypothetical protein Ae201684P_020712 [Aphanomyces euteiches]|nr:hypothetical protein Ae201684P_020712 [Aphanomyces euteiches]
MLFLDILLIENETPRDSNSLIDAYVHAWRWLRLLYRPGNTAQLLIEASSHMMSLVVIVKLRKVLKAHAVQSVPVQKFHAMLLLLIKTMPPWQDLSKLMEPNYWFKKVEQHFLGLQSLYLPKPLMHELQAIPTFDVNEPYWITNGLAFLEGDVMGMSLDVEQRSIAQIKTGIPPPRLHAKQHTAQYPAQPPTIPIAHDNVHSICQLWVMATKKTVRHPNASASLTISLLCMFLVVVNTPMVVAEDKRLFGFGWGEAGRLGTGEIWQVPRTSDAGECHSAAIDDDGNVYTWGFGGSGALGRGNLENDLVPTVVPLLKAQSIGCGHALAGQLGDIAVTLGEMRTTPHKITVSQVSAARVSCGSFTTAILSTAGEVYHWGSPEAGNGHR